MSADQVTSKEDSELFAEACRDVRRLFATSEPLKAAKPTPDPVQTWIDRRQVLQESLGLLPSGDDGEEEDDSYLRDGVQKFVLRKLKKGQYCVNVGLDLHGLTAPLAEQAVTDFCNQARHSGARCLRIVHGKGWRSGNRGPVLKPLVRRLLTRRDDVLAFCPARPHDGGTGALYVLLKRG